MDCIFCKIIKGEIPSYTVYEDNIVKVFLDISPVENGHMLIIPKEHCLDIDDIKLETITHIYEVAKKMHLLLKEKLNIDGMQVVQNNGTLEEVKHYHMHLIPHMDGELKDVKEIYELLTK